MTITPVYAGILGLFFVLLSVNVIRTRRSAGVGLGAGDNQLLERRIRAHGNFAEYAPIALILIFIVEQQGAGAASVHGLNILLLAGRLSHGMALSSLTPMPALRISGIALTFAAVVSSSITVAISPLFAA